MIWARYVWVKRLRSTWIRDPRHIVCKKHCESGLKCLRVNDLSLICLRMRIDSEVTRLKTEWKFWFLRGFYRTYILIVQSITVVCHVWSYHYPVSALKIQLIYGKKLAHLILSRLVVWRPLCPFAICNIGDDGTCIFMNIVRLEPNSR